MINVLTSKKILSDIMLLVKAKFTLRNFTLRRIYKFYMDIEFYNIQRTILVEKSKT